MDPLVAFVKRVIDITVSSIGLSVLLLLYPIIAILIKINSPGPIIFRQLRVGESQSDYTKLFIMYKFRSMRVDAEDNQQPLWASKDDPRTTTIGRILRKTRLDEFPQFYNVLRGDMSLIGPRPERPGLFNQLEKNIPFYSERIQGVKPGITGYAQVFRGYDGTIDDVRIKLAYDYAYIVKLTHFREWYRMEALILILTVYTVFMGKGQ